VGRAKKQTELIQGRAAHRRTEGDYMAVLLETVTLDDWRGVVSTAKARAKAGDPQARAWLAQAPDAAPLLCCLLRRWGRLGRYCGWGWGLGWLRFDFSCRAS
jgi:hypothetical protein